MTHSLIQRRDKLGLPVTLRQVAQQIEVLEQAGVHARLFQVRDVVQHIEQHLFGGGFIHADSITEARNG